MNTLLSGVVGSTAYGLNTAHSDVDRLGVFAAPTEAVLGLDPVRESVVTTRPDVTLHEAGKVCGLLLSGNPTVTELLWLPADLYETVTPLGEELLGIRAAFLSRRQVRRSYLGYATGQLHRIRKDLDNPPTLGNPAGRVAKDARHMARLLHQGQELYETGRLMVRLDADTATAIHEFGRAVAAGDVDRAAARLAAAEKAMDAADRGTAGPVLPDQPDKDLITDWLLRVRTAHWDRSGVAA